MYVVVKKKLFGFLRSRKTIQGLSSNDLFIGRLLIWVSLTGKMFKSAELPWLIQFFQMFYNDKPVDWLLDHLIFTKVCNWDKNSVSIAAWIKVPFYFCLYV
jgi:alpha-1,3-mannosylglycoprotein beta-1,4-N-acetylglucosaminyltransferase A/B